MKDSIYLGSETYARIDPDTQAIIIDAPTRVLKIPLANAMGLAELIEEAIDERNAEDGYVL